MNGPNFVAAQVVEPREASYRLRILHLSDLHERGVRESENWRRRRVLGAAWERNLQEILEAGPLDLICFTGDVANFGVADEYQGATTFFNALLQGLGIGRDRLFVIPGNHDIERSIEPDAWQSLTEIIGRLDPLDFSRWMAGQATLPGLSSSWREGVLRRQGAYRAWLRRGIGRPELNPEGSAHGSLGYRSTLTIRALPFPVHVLGLDSSWLCGRNGEAGALWITEDQLMRLATDVEGKPLEGLRLALVHHPFGELADGAQCRRLLAEHVDLLLRGHLHEAEVEMWADPDRTLRQFAAGCLYETGRADHYPNSFQVVDLELSPVGKIISVDVLIRSWSPRSGQWYADNSLYRAVRKGVGSANTSPQYKPGEMRNPFNPWTPVLPGQLAGRMAAIRHFEIAAAERRSVSLVGDRRIGKTSVLRTVADRARKQGRIVVELSGEGPEGLSLGSFVSTVTLLPVEDDADRAANLLSQWAGSTVHGDQAPILLVDEVDGMLARFEHRFFERLRGMLGKICLFFSSCRELDHIYLDLGRTSPFHNRLQIQWLGLLEPQAVEAVTALGGSLLTLEERQLMVAWAGRSPFFLQLFGWHLVEAHLLGGRTDEALDAFRTEASPRLRELWRLLGDNERNILTKSASGSPILDRRLRTRGLLEDDGRIFGRVLEAWILEEAS